MDMTLEGKSLFPALVGFVLGYIWMMCEESEEVFTKTSEYKDRTWVVPKNGLVEKWSAGPECPWCVTEPELIHS